MRRHEVEVYDYKLTANTFIHKVPAEVDGSGGPGPPFGEGVLRDNNLHDSLNSAAARASRMGAA